jgi:hypothetical protein
VRRAAASILGAGVISVIAIATAVYWPSKSERMGTKERCRAAAAAFIFEHDNKARERPWVMGLEPDGRLSVGRGPMKVTDDLLSGLRQVKTDPDDLDDWGKWSRHAPDKNLIRRYFEAPESNPALDCPGFRALAATRGVSFDPKNLSNWRRPGAPLSDAFTLFRYTEVTMSTPVLSNDGNEAIGSIQIWQSRLGHGGEWLIWLKRDSEGLWRVVDENQHAIS